jgi:DNA-binding response OmpR family regulator
MAATSMRANWTIPMPELQAHTIPRVLVIEHDGALQRILERLFSSEGHEVDIVSRGLGDLEMLRQRPPSAVILDLPYREASGCDLCREILNLFPGTALVILGASLDVVDKPLLLKMGADEYVTLPFSPRELLERLRALMRRASRSPKNLCVFEAGCS